MSDTDLAFRATLDGSGFASGMQNINGQLNQLGVQTNASTANLGSLGTVIGTLANPLTIAAAGVAALGAAFIGSVQAASAWETSMAGVAKTTGLAGPELHALSSELLDMSSNMPVAASELASIAEVAGSLGIAQENIAGFVETASQMSVAFNMPADAAATMGAKILNSFQLPTENMQNLGNVVNAMGDNFAATEGQVLNFLNRASFLGSAMGQTVPQVAALGTVLISSGMEAEVAATGVQALLTSMQKVGAKPLSELMGTGMDEINKMLSEDFSGTLTEIADKIAAIEDPVERFNAAMTIGGEQGGRTLLKLAGQSDNLKDALSKANGEWENGSSMMKTFEANSATLESQMGILQNVINKAAVELGNVFLPSVTQGIKLLTDLAKGAIATGEALYGLTSAWNEWIASSSTGQQWAALEKAYEETTKGYWQIIGEDAVWIGEDFGRAYSGGICAGISDSYEELDSTVNETLEEIDPSQAAQDAADKWVKGFGDAAEKGMTAVGRRIDKKTGEVLSEGIWTFTGDRERNQATAYFEYLGHQISYLEDRTGSVFDQIFSVDNIDMPTISGYQLMNRLEAFTLATGLPAPEEGTAEYYYILLDKVKAKQIELQEALKAETNQINLWDTFGEMRNWDKFVNDNKDIVENAGRNLTQVLYEAMGRSLEAESPTLSTSLANVMQALAKPGSVPAEILNTSLADLIDAGIIGAEWKDEIILASSEAISGAADVIIDKSKYLESKMEDVGKALGKAMVDGTLEIAEQELLTELAQKYVDAGGNADDKLIKLILSEDWAGVGAQAGGEVGKGFTSALLGEIKGNAIPTLAEMLADPAKLKEQLGDEELFIKNTFLPNLKNDMDEAARIYNTGITENMRQSEEYLDGLKKTYEEHSTWFDGWQRDLLGKYYSHQISAEGLFYIWDAMENRLDKTNQKLKDQSVGYNQLQKAMEDCSECAISDFGKWQESQDNLFQASYIGPGGQGYLDWKTQQVAAIADTQRAMKAAGGVVVGQDYTQSPLLQRTIELDMDKSKADTALDSIQSNLNKLIEMANPVDVDADIQAAQTKIDQLLSQITAGATMPVDVIVHVDAGYIQAAVNEAISNALS